MKQLILAAMTLCVATLAGCNGQKGNPLLQPFDTPFQTPPFDKIKPEHYRPAIEAGITEMLKEVEAIATNPEAPTFDNTIVALERRGERLRTITAILDNLTEADTNPQLDSVAEAVQPLLTKAENDVMLDPRIFARVKDVYNARLTLVLDQEQKMLLEKTYLSFTMSGAGLSDTDKARYRDITDELAALTLKFGKNVLAATNAFEMVLTEDQVAGLPGFVKESMAHEAKGKDKEGYLLTLQAPSMGPFMTYSPNREIKEKVWRAYSSRCLAAGPNSNSDVVRRITALRMQLANLLGYKTYADYALVDRMAKDPATVNSFLSDLLTATKPWADKDMETIRNYAATKGCTDLKPWDWAYYEELYRQEKFALNEDEVKPYLKLENVEKGIFMLADTLFGLKFKESKDVPVFNPDVRTYEVYGRDGKFLAVLYLDFFPRAGKRGGAWMTVFRDMYAGADGKEVRPLVSLTCNFTKPTADKPSLLTFNEFQTFLHEFGHCIHGIVARGKYASLTGTNVYRDFVEFPSQMLENWCTEKDFLDMWAVNYQTGEKIPADLIAKIVAAKNYNAAYKGVRQLFFGLDDMAWHTITSPVTMPVDAFEQAATVNAQMFPVEKGTCMSTAFDHIFSGGYAAGYYSYKWAEVLEADAFSLFKEKGIFNREVANSYLHNILEKGGSEDPMEMYIRFRGRRPEMLPLLEKMGALVN